jgi:hypothetical protein
MLTVALICVAMLSVTLLSVIVMRSNMLSVALMCAALPSVTDESQNAECLLADCSSCAFNSAICCSAEY